ncbi:MAG TPA: threonine--tRNA ligase [Micromonosporaceae bacterium]|nr:threonine--tRNA ligase [Micromonosporaceae bacterium]
MIVNDPPAPADHRRLGRELDIFDSHPLIGAGLPFWQPSGAAARFEIESYLRELERRAGYQFVYSPVLGKRALYERSGHLAHFADDMFPPMRMSADDELVLRPTMCPHHALIFGSRPRSYRDLPVRIAEIGGQYRAERSGVLGGLGRVRAMSLNDAHNFCALSQVRDEIAAVLALIREAHQAIGIASAGFRLSLRGDGDKYAGAPDMWRRAEAMLREALDDAAVDYVEEAGEAAFYGPKIDVQVADPIERESSISTIQLDFHQPAQFALSYVDASGDRPMPVMIHRSLVGSMERLFAYLIEAYRGAFPVWYAPVQLVVVPVSDDEAAAAAGVAVSAAEVGLRAELEVQGSVGARVRDAALRKVPYVAVIGAREAADGLVALRLRDGRQLEPMPSAAAVALIAGVAASRSQNLLPD